MNPFSYFDHIACINLFSREDRYQYCQSLFKKLNIDVHFHRVHKHPNGGQEGCFQSHIDIIVEAFNKNAETCLIFEDDIELGPSYNPKLVQLAIDFMKSNNDWHIFYFGCTPEIIRHTTRKVSPNIYHLHGLCTHAYVIHRRLMEKMIGMRYSGMAIDAFYLHNKYAYGILPSLISQKTDQSDIAMNNLSESPFRSVFQRGVDYYAMHINYPLYKIAIVLCIAFFLLLILYILNPSQRFTYLIILIGLIIILTILI